jgi:hypothetical protein
MKTYPSIRGPKQLGLPCYAFYKYDGSNLRFEWTKKSGWVKYGTRKRLFDSSDVAFGEAIDIFNDTLAVGLDEVFRDKYAKAEKITAYAEFLGKKSFAGQHIKDDPKELVLFDVSVHKKGLVSPSDFIEHFGHLNSAEVIYDGLMDQDFIDRVRNGHYQLDEGVIVKGGSGHQLWMCKIKTLTYLAKLKETYGSDWIKYWEDA